MYTAPSLGGLNHGGGSDGNHVAADGYSGSEDIARRTVECGEGGLLHPDRAVKPPHLDRSEQRAEWFVGSVSDDRNVAIEIDGRIKIKPRTVPHRNWRDDTLAGGFGGTQGEAQQGD